MRCINREAIYSAGTGYYREPAEVNAFEEFKLRIRTEKNDVDEVYLCFFENESKIERKKMEKVKSDFRFDYYESIISTSNTRLYYGFLLVKGEERLSYGRVGVCNELKVYNSYKVIPGFFIPKWIKGKVMYQIFIDRFCDGDKTNNVCDREYIYLGRPVEAVKDWSAGVESLDVARFYGGDLQGVMDKIDYLYYLGVRVIYFNPLFVSPSNHKYDIQDYDHIDPHIGKILLDGGSVLSEGDTNNENAEKYILRTTDKRNLEASDRLFVELVEKCHKKGIKVIIDGVFNHCGSYNKWMDKSGFYKEALSEDGAYWSKESPYRNYFSFSDENSWPCNESYEQWWGNDTLPKLNYEGSRELENEIYRIAAKWVSPPFNCDGWRLDVAADLGHSEDYNHEFWRNFRRVVKEANPEAVIIAEHYGNPENWLMGDQWDSIMNYDAFMEPVSWFLTGMEKHSDYRNEALKGDGERFFESIFHNMSRMPENSIHAAMNQLSNHDHSRFLTRTNMQTGRLDSRGSKAAGEGINKALYCLGSMIQMTWPGAPAIYYGDEIGMYGWTEPDSRKPFPWDKNDNLELLEYHHYLTATRRHSKALSKGSVMKLAAGKNFISYARIYEEEIALIVINASDEEYPIFVPAWKAGLSDDMKLVRTLRVDFERYNAGKSERNIKDGYFRSYMLPYSGKIYIAKWPKNWKNKEN